MKPVRALASLVLACAVASAAAQSPYPDKPITIIVGFTAGGSTDIVTRLIAKEMQKSWAQPIVVENKAGAGGNKTRPASWKDLFFPNVHNAPGS